MKINFLPGIKKSGQKVEFGSFAILSQNIKLYESDVMWCDLFARSFKKWLAHFACRNNVRILSAWNTFKAISILLMKEGLNGSDVGKQKYPSWYGGSFEITITVTYKFELIKFNRD